MNKWRLNCNDIYKYIQVWPSAVKCWRVYCSLRESSAEAVLPHPPSVRGGHVIYNSYKWGSRIHISNLQFQVGRRRYTWSELPLRSLNSLLVVVEAAVTRERRVRSFGWPLLFVVYAKIAIFAKTFRIQCSVWVLAGWCLLCSTFRMIAVLAHTVGVVLFWCMRTFIDVLSMFLNVLSFW